MDVCVGLQSLAISQDLNIALDEPTEADATQKASFSTRPTSDSTRHLTWKHWITWTITSGRDNEGAEPAASGRGNCIVSVRQRTKLITFASKYRGTRGGRVDSRFRHSGNACQSLTNVTHDGRGRCAHASWADWQVGWWAGPCSAVGREGAKVSRPVRTVQVRSV